MRRAPLQALLLLILAACGPAISPQEEARRQEMASIRQKQSDLAGELDGLRAGLRGVEARLGAQELALEQLRDREKAQKVTPDREKAGPPPSPVAPPSPPGPPSAGDIYQQAFGEYATGRCPQAIAGFDTFLRLHPDHEQRGNALFWLGECYYAGQHYAKAAEAFAGAAEVPPPRGRAPEALRRLAETLTQMQQNRRAAEVLDLLRQQYPDSETARSLSSGN